jgi:glycine betaine/proline transport system substrate-binding protein
MKKLASIFTVALVIILVMGATGQAEKKELKAGVLQWSDQITLGTIGTYMLKEKFGYKVKTVEFFEWGLAFAALERGDIDFMPALINFCCADYWNRSKEKLEKIGVPSYGMDMGLVVPSYVPVNSIAELNQQKEKFGKKIIGIEPGSGLVRQTKQVVKGYDLDFTLVEGSTAAVNAALKSAIQKKEWILVTHWVPAWPMLVWDLKFLKDPKGIQQGPQAYHYIGRKGFQKDYPFAREVLSGIFIHVDHINQWAAWFKEEKTKEEALKLWLTVKANQDLVDRWATIASPDRYK